MDLCIISRLIEHVLCAMPITCTRLHVFRARSLAGEVNMSGGCASSCAMSTMTGGCHYSTYEGPWTQAGASGKSSRRKETLSCHWGLSRSCQGERVETCHGQRKQSKPGSQRGVTCERSVRRSRAAAGAKWRVARRRGDGFPRRRDIR